MRHALKGMSVVALEQAVAAPYCSRKLAEAGARVIKIESPGGDFARGYDAIVDGQSTYFTWLNVGKESISLDLRAGGDRQLLGRMLTTADVFVQNLRPGSVAGMGFDPSELQRRNPRLVSCDIVGFARPAEHFARKAYDLLIQAESGLASVTGMDAAGSRVGVSVVDIATGASAYQAILEALLSRATTGQGAHLEISMFDVMAEWMSVPYLYARHLGRAPARGGLKHPSIAPYGAFRCLDGRLLMVAVQQDREWRSLCKIFLGDDALAEDPMFSSNSARVSNRTRVDAAVDARMASLSFDQAVALLRQADVAYAQVGTAVDLANHPALRTFDVATESGLVRLPLPPDREPPPDGSVPRVPGRNEHGAAIRAEYCLQRES